MQAAKQAFCKRSCRHSCGCCGNHYADAVAGFVVIVVADILSDGVAGILAIVVADVLFFRNCKKNTKKGVGK